MSVSVLLEVGGIISFSGIDEQYYVNVRDLHSNAELLELNKIPIISIEVELWSLITWI